VVVVVSSSSFCFFVGGSVDFPVVLETCPDPEEK